MACNVETRCFASPAGQVVQRTKPCNKQLHVEQRRDASRLYEGK